jgi:hypothetical protein
MQLPWSSTDATSVAREAAAYRELTNAERIDHLARACAGAAHLLQLRDDSEAVLAYRDPISQETRAALAQLRTKRKTHGVSTR